MAKNKKIDILSAVVLAALISSYGLFAIFDLSIYFYFIATGTIVFYLMARFDRVIDARVLNSGLMLYLFILLALFSNFWALDGRLALTKSLSLLVLAGIATVYASLAVRTPGVLMVLGGVLALFSGMVVIYLYSRYGTIRMLYSEGYGYYLVVGNSLSAQVVLAIPLLVSGMMESTRIDKKIIYLTLLFVGIISVVLSQSRAAYILGVVGVAGYVFFYTEESGIKTFNKKYIAIGLLVTGFSFLVLFGNKLMVSEVISPVINRISNSSLITGRGMRDELRIEMYKAIPDILMGHPISGIGYESYSQYSWMRYGVREFSHSILLTGAELGVFGVAVCVLMIVIAMWRSISKYVRSSGADKNYHLAILLSVSIGIAHAFFRPQFQNIMFLVVLLVAGVKERGIGRYGKRVNRTNSQRMKLYNG